MTWTSTVDRRVPIHPPRGWHAVYMDLGTGKPYSVPLVGIALAAWVDDDNAVRAEGQGIVADGTRFVDAARGEVGVGTFLGYDHPDSAGTAPARYAQLPPAVLAAWEDE